MKRRAFHPSILSSPLCLASTAQVWFRRSQGCPLTLAGAEPDKPSPPPTAKLSSTAHLHFAYPFSLSVSLILVPPPLLHSAQLCHGHRSPISEVIMTKMNDPQETGLAEIREKEEYGRGIERGGGKDW